MKNRIVRTLSIGVLSAGAALTSSLAVGAERGFYVGGYYGQTKTSLDITRFDEIAQAIYSSGGFDVFSSTSTLDDETASYGFFGGYRLSRHFAFEGGYMDLGRYVYDEHSVGEFPATDTLPVEPGEFSQRLSVQTRGIAVSALAILPLSYRAELYARGGIMLSNNKLKGSVADATGSAPTGQRTKSGSNFLVGVGGGFTFAEIYTVRLEYERIMEVGDELTGKEDVDLIQLAVTVAF
ncbi:MAG TPA: outer membrane beta-barrel protein [Povalibacter sp.]|nr:outer membrane beta-barrel protein [Povalibacter sp.]